MTLLDKQAAQNALGGISIATLDRMLLRGELPHVKIGRRVFVLRDDIDAYIQAHRHREGRST